MIKASLIVMQHHSPSLLFFFSFFHFFLQGTRTHAPNTLYMSLTSWGTASAVMHHNLFYLCLKGNAYETQCNHAMSEQGFMTLLSLVGLEVTCRCQHLFFYFIFFICIFLLWYNSHHSTQVPHHQCYNCGSNPSWKWSSIFVLAICLY